MLRSTARSGYHHSPPWPAGGPKADDAFPGPLAAPSICASVCESQSNAPRRRKPADGSPDRVLENLPAMWSAPPSSILTCFLSLLLYVRDSLVWRQVYSVSRRGGVRVGGSRHKLLFLCGDAEVVSDDRQNWTGPRARVCVCVCARPTFCGFLGLKTGFFARRTFHQRASLLDKTRGNGSTNGRPPGSGGTSSKNKEFSHSKRQLDGCLCMRGE